MGFLEIRKDDKVTPSLQEKIILLKPKSSEMIDDVAEIYLNAMQGKTPRGQTNELFEKTIISVEEFLTRYIYSEASHFEYIVLGHKVYGPIFSDRQRRWWFWYLNEVLGGSYTNKTDGFQTPYDYPLEAFNEPESSVDTRINTFLDFIVE